MGGGGAARGGGASPRVARYPARTHRAPDRDRSRGRVGASGRNRASGRRVRDRVPPRERNGCARGGGIFRSSLASHLPAASPVEEARASHRTTPRRAPATRSTPCLATTASRPARAANEAPSLVAATPRAEPEGLTRTPALLATVAKQCARGATVDFAAARGADETPTGAAARATVACMRFSLWDCERGRKVRLARAEKCPAPGGAHRRGC